MRNVGASRRRPIPSHGRRRPADHQPCPAVTRRAADAVRPAHHPHPRCAARCRRPLRPAGAGAADSAHGAFRRGQRVRLIGDGRAQEQGRVRLPRVGRDTAQTLEVGQSHCRRSPWTPDPASGPTLPRKREVPPPRAVPARIVVARAGFSPARRGCCRAARAPANRKRRESPGNCPAAGSPADSLRLRRCSDHKPRCHL